MKGLLIFNLGKRSRMLVAMTLAMIALATLLLGVGSELPTASASTLPPVKPENVTAAYTYYLPIVSKASVPIVVYSDHFTNDGTGWTATGSNDCTGKYDEGDSVYRVTIDHADRSCIVWNGSLPRQFYGTFYVRARYTSSSADMRYGIQFDTAANSTDGSGTRWAFEVYPKKSSDCHDKPFFWLTAIKSGVLKWHNYNGDDECTNSIDTEKGDWNRLAAVRHGRTVDVYIDGAGDMHQDFKSVYQFSTDEADKYGYFQMRVVSGSSAPVQVEFDQIEIRSTITAPW